jgi:hypothetical protein
MQLNLGICNAVKLYLDSSQLVQVYARDERNNANNAWLAGGG